MSKGILLSRANFPVIVTYGNSSMVISPKGSVVIEDVSLLPANLPKELVLKVK